MTVSAISEESAAITPGRFTKAIVHSPAGELEARLSEAGNWEVSVRSEGDQGWRQVCRGDMRSGARMDDGPERWGQEPIRLGPLTIDRCARQARVDGAPVRLGRKEFSLLSALATRPNDVFSKAELMEAVWGDSDPTRTRTLDSHVSRLRRKLCNAGMAGAVVNIWGVGYRLWEVADLSAAPSHGRAA